MVRMFIKVIRDLCILTVLRAAVIGVDRGDRMNRLRLKSSKIVPAWPKLNRATSAAHL
jgi:hypothetical protein